MANDADCNCDGDVDVDVGVGADASTDVAADSGLRSSRGYAGLLWAEGQERSTDVSQKHGNRSGWGKCIEKSRLDIKRDR